MCWSRLTVGCLIKQLLYQKRFVIFCDLFERKMVVRQRRPSSQVLHLMNKNRAIFKIFSRISHWRQIWRHSKPSRHLVTQKTMETREQCVKYVKVNNKDIRTTSMTSFWCLYCYLLTDFTHCSSVSIADFGQLNTG